MNLWTWVLIALSLSGAILAIGSALMVLSRAARLRRRVQAMAASRLVTSLRGLQIEGDRLSGSSARITPLIGRAKSAIASMKSGIAGFRLPQARDAMQSAGGEISTLLDELR